MEDNNIILIGCILLCASVLIVYYLWSDRKEKRERLFIEACRKNYMSDLKWLTYSLAIISKLTGILNTNICCTDKKHYKRILKEHLLYCVNKREQILYPETEFKILAEGYTAIDNYEEADKYWEKAMRIVEEPNYNNLRSKLEIHRCYARYSYTTGPYKGYIEFKKLIQELSKYLPPKNTDSQTTDSEFQLEPGFQDEVFGLFPLIIFQNEIIITLYDWLDCHSKKISSFDNESLQYICEEAKKYKDPLLEEKIKEIKKLKIS